MKVARILEADAYTMATQHPESRYTEYVIVNECEYMGGGQVLACRFSKKDRHLTLEAAKEAAWGQGYKYYIYKGRRVKLRESRNQKRYNLDWA